MRSFVACLLLCCAAPLIALADPVNINTADAATLDRALKGVGPARAEAILEDLAELFRHALVDQGESVTLAQEIALARHYLQIEQARFGERLRVQWQLDEAVGAARLPPLLRSRNRLNSPSC